MQLRGGRAANAKVANYRTKKPLFKATTKQKQPDQMPKYSFRSVPCHCNGRDASIGLALMLVHTFFLAL